MMFFRQGPVPMLAVQSLPTAAAVAAAAATAKIQAIDAVASNLGLSTSEILGRSLERSFICFREPWWIEQSLAVQEDLGSIPF